ncbi:hypothetical protein Hamer_G016114 [Homarus americanus]|uniref:Uncharacterized protein n=1 Tax=Homarus americanus TaxID=6706 RepID=A0A8J5K5J0_HOMAM|nr:hypothetical protein Hamer_G016114 [Homarus americanus]
MEKIGDSDSDQVLPANQEEEEETVDDLTPSTSPPHKCEVLSVCEFWKKYNIKNAVDRIVEAWRKINVATVLHAWKPFFANSEIIGVEQTAASGERQSMAATLMDTAEAAHSVPAPVFSEVQVEDLQEIVGQLTELVPNIARLSEQLEEYDTGPHPRNLMCSALDKGMEENKALYMSCVNAGQQALITRYLGKA